MSLLVQTLSTVDYNFNLFIIIFTDLLVIWTFINKDNTPITLTGCQYSTININCPINSIQIINGYYGRNQDKTTCSSGSQLPCCTSACTYFDRTSLISSTCDSLASCSLSAVSSIFDNPCSGHRKYLKVTYQCSGKKISIICQV